ncbi:TonB-dependent receptor [Flavobacterium gawalongense]|uniref:TonB-dependent receptor n=1 Tax=Flavobacterium gawalongense TaxID=2594432 RepID=A0A553BK52_9FLAO|nr:TonB-dependent receptor [Flavobacterium gawalongense]TRX00322.1 TonB-dependent receptor [Flavobacterium gawalongense]TRX08380.1 TonB-dependent receptor [Flavobacterium gawalongense]TRX08624.1 TonB-dependent receptor [Flavobacterium gawalongense]TRX09607.1 TonB-dependent receptor [Flavobacterium gawalongense]TRX25616.1 TonB-dependent receptor [Flavobacterium gawalongense]
MKKLALLLFMLNVTFLFAQKEISGFVIDNAGVALSGVNITEKGTNNSVSTDINGAYQINVKEGATLVFSYFNFPKQEYDTTDPILNVVLSEEGGQSLSEVVVTGTRATPRSNTTTTLPIDILSSEDLTSTGQATFDKALQYRIPSFNTAQTPVNDATSLLDPYEIRNMGPSRTLILINGKRKNLSSLLYVQTSPGQGETGADISAIPIDAIERVEILRDGASPQYGSDAIAGVINIILKKKTDNGSITVKTGITAEGDGEMLGVSLNNGSTVGEKGFVNYTLDFSKVNLADRPGKVDLDGDFADFGGTISGVNTLADVKSFLAKYPDAQTINGSPETAAAKFLINGGSDLSADTQLYYNAAYVYKKVNSFANYRTPYWGYGGGITLNDLPYLLDFFGDGTVASYKGYHPTFIGDLNDYNASLGYKFIRNGWNTDASITVGGNTQTYTVENSHNRSDIKDSNGVNVYQENSPIFFKPGGEAFNHIVGNLDISKVLSDKISVGFGSEIRTETFEVIEGDKASWDGFGADSFAGNRPENSGKWNRYNLGGYFDLAYDFTKDFLVNGTVRYEDYSDFGGATVWKLSSRYKFSDDKITLRGSVSTGFRAPTLHQIYTQKSQYSFSPGQGIQVSGIINNVSLQARQLGIPRLDAEKSTNITVGIGVKPLKNFNFTIDYYNIKVKDRIILGDKVATQFGTVAWFENSFDSRTSGLDVVINYRTIELGTGELGFNLSGNVTFENKRISPVASDNFGTTLDALMFTSRPETKWILGANYKIKKFDFYLNNTYFGKTTFKQAGLDSSLRTEFIPKIVTDLGINYAATDKLTVALNMNNLLNVLPEWEFKAENVTGTEILADPAQVKNQSNLITFNGRYSQMTSEGYHFSQLGTQFSLSLIYEF